VGTTNVSGRKRVLLTQGRNYPIDAQLFAAPSPTASYFGGLLLADGCVTDRGVIILSLKAEDQRLVESFRSALAPSAPVRVRRPKDGRGKPGPQAIFRVTCRAVVAQLAAYGVLPRKSAIARVPRAFEDDVNYWRGVIDGDGHVGMHPHNGDSDPVIIIYGTKRVCRQFKAFAERMLETTIPTCPRKAPEKAYLHRLSIYGWDNAVALIALLYAGAPRQLRLERKYRTALAILRATRGRTGLETERATAFREQLNAALQTVCARHLAKQVGVAHGTLRGWSSSSRQPHPRNRENFLARVAKAAPVQRCTGCRYRSLPGWRRGFAATQQRSAALRKLRPLDRAVRGRKQRV
jgi:hypothetical protein